MGGVHVNELSRLCHRLNCPCWFGFGWLIPAADSPRCPSFRLVGFNANQPGGAGHFPWVGLASHCPTSAFSTRGCEFTGVCEREKERKKISMRPHYSCLPLAWALREGKKKDWRQWWRPFCFLLLLRPSVCLSVSD